MTFAHSSYPYRELAHREIRLLEVEPAALSEPIYGRLCHVSLDDHYDYVAISYAWGDPGVQQPLELEDGELSITPSLAQAIQRFRYNAQHIVDPILFWADQICINQSDPVERGRQARMVSQIYRRAKCVWSWLGEEQPFDIVAFQTLRILGKFVEDEYPNSSTPPGKHAWPTEVVKRLTAYLNEKLTQEQVCRCCKRPYNVATDPVGAAIDAIHKLDQRAWFSRLWVVQEMFCAEWALLSAGTHMINAQQLQNAGVAVQQLLSVRRGPPFSNAPSIFALGKHIHDQKYSPDLPLAIQCQLMLYSKAATEPRDRVFALHELAMTGHDHTLRADYSVSTTDLYIRFALHVLNHPAKSYRRRGGGAIILALSGTQDRSKCSRRLPSWVPDLHGLTKSSNFKGTMYARHNSMRAGGFHSFRVYTDSTTPGVLRVPGVIFSTIAACLKYADYQAAESMFFEGRHPRTEAEASNIRSLPFYYVCQNFITAGGAYPKREASTDVLRRTLICDVTHQIYPLSPEASYEQCFQAYATFADLHLNQDAPGYDDPLVLQAAKFLQAWQVQSEYHRMRQLCRTANGYVGWIPIAASMNDVCAIFAGAPWPFVLRRQASGQYKVLGDAYVHGIMDGSGIPLDNASLEIFELV